MATKSSKYPYKWPDGSYHSIPYAQHQQNTTGRTPWAPPPGTYDPSLDMQERAARTGAGQTGEDISRGSERETTDFGIGQTEIGRQRGEYEQDYQGNLSDILRARTQGQEDYQTNLQTLGRNFQRLGNTQQQRGRQMGLSYGGGAAQQGVEKRAANQAIEKGTLDTGFNRFMEGSQIAEQRLNLDRERAVGAEGSFARATGQLELGHGRAQEDYTTTARRAGTGLQDYLQDLSATRQSQFRQQTGLPLGGKKKKKAKV